MRSWLACCLSYDNRPTNFGSKWIRRFLRRCESREPLSRKDGVRTHVNERPDDPADLWKIQSPHALTIPWNIALIRKRSHSNCFPLPEPPSPVLRYSGRSCPGESPVATASSSIAIFHSSRPLINEHSTVRSYRLPLSIIR